MGHAHGGSAGGGLARSAVRAVRMALLFALLVIPVAPPPSAEAAPIHYLYDPLGRLIAVVDLSAEAAIFRYDPVGNLLAVTRQPANQASIIDFVPKTGPAGTVVCVLGTGFSAAAAENTVRVNGVTAQVVSATNTEICVSIPPGSTTGLLTVTSPAGTDTSDTSFTSTASSTPVITGFTPIVAGPGVDVTIQGSNFEPLPANNVVTINTRHASSATASPTTLTVPVAGGTSGRLKVSTPNGEAVAPGDLFIPPPLWTPSQVEATGRLEINGPSQSFTVTQSSNVGLVVFDGTAGQFISIASPTTGVVTRLWNPDGSQPGILVFSRDDVDVVLPVTGTYTLTLEPSPSPGTTTLILSEPQRGTIELDGPPVNLVIDRPGQNAYLSFHGTAGQYLSAAAVGSTFATGTAWGILNPDGSILVQRGGLSGDFDVTLPTSGTYQIAVNAGIATGSVSFYLSSAFTAPITIDGPTVPATTRPGQDVVLPFDGTAGQRVSLGASGSTYPCCPAYGILNPGATSVLAQSGIGGDVDVVLPTSGTYYVKLNAADGAGSINLTLTSPVATPLPLDGTPVTLTFRPGQDARLPIQGTQGQGVGIGFRNIAISTPVVLLAPDGSQLATACPGCNDDIDIVLPVDGTYTLLLDPGNATGSIAVVGSTEIAGPITIDGPSVTVSPTTGQNGRLTFDGSAGQRLGIGFTNIAISGATVRLLDPSGTELGTACVGCAQTIAAQLAATGTHTIVVDANNASGSLTVWLSEEITGTLAVNGPSIPVAINRAGQDARYTFDGTAGQTVTVRVTGSTSGCEKVTLLDPQGTSLTFTSSCFSSYSLAPQTLTQSGIHTITVDPSGNATVNANLSVTSP